MPTRFLPIPSLHTMTPQYAPCSCSHWYYVMFKCEAGNLFGTDNQDEKSGIWNEGLPAHSETDALSPGDRNTSCSEEDSVRSKLSTNTVADAQAFEAGMEEDSIMGRTGIYLCEGDEYVGPFQSHEDAERFLLLMKASGESPEGIEIVELSNAAGVGCRGDAALGNASKARLSRKH